MRTYIGFDTAVEHWRRHDNLPPWGLPLLIKADDQAFPCCGKKTVRQVAQCETSRKAYRELTRLYQEPVHVLTADATNRRPLSSVVFHHASVALPRGSFIEVSKNLFVACPELTFVQMASKLSFGELLALGFEFCGRYTIRPESPRGFEPRLPLTTPRKIASFAQRATNLRGSRLAQLAARFLLANSASPAESQLAILLTLPNAKGGYGLTPATLNLPIPVTGEAAKLTRKSILIGDAVWENERLIVEYDGKIDHSNPLKLAEDAERRNALRAMGYTVIVVTAGHLYNESSFHEIARMIASELNERIRIRSANFYDARRDLRRELFDRPSGQACKPSLNALPTT